MIGPTALPTPYVLSTPVFRFRALAALAGRSPLGGPREVALAIFLVARLADDCQPARALSATARASRAHAARGWLASTALPAAVRAPLVRVADASERDASEGDASEGNAKLLAAALRVAADTAATYLDAAARAELERLARALDR